MRLLWRYMPTATYLECYKQLDEALNLHSSTTSFTGYCAIIGKALWNWAAASCASASAAAPAVDTVLTSPWLSSAVAGTVVLLVAFVANGSSARKCCNHCLGRRTQLGLDDCACKDCVANKLRR